MKKWYKFLFLPVLILALAGCSKDDDDESIEVEDGKVTQLQKHTIGKGVPIAIMCRNFTDRDIASGKYREAVNWALEGLFSVHPMKSLRDYFDVYEITAVAWYDNSQDSSTPSYVQNESNDGVFGYAHKAFGEDLEDLEDVVLIVLNNKHFRSCASWSSSSQESDIPSGFSSAFVWFPQRYDGTIRKDYDPSVLLHEFGHAFAGLGDEYVEEASKWDDIEGCKKFVMDQQNSGYKRNLSFDSDVTKSYWADLAADSRYDFEKLGCYEGGEYQEKGVYRPTENSIMRDNETSSYFNVVARVMIYKRCMKIAYGDSWKFNYEDFVKFDLEKAKAAYQADKEQHSTSSTSKRFCAPPRFVDSYSWQRVNKPAK